MNNKQVIEALEVLLVQSSNNYHMSDEDIKRAKRATEVMNGHLRAVMHIRGIE